MNKQTISDKDLNALLKSPGTGIEDLGFSAAVMKRINRRRILVSMIPAVSGFIGAMITIAALPEGWMPSLLNRLTDPLLGISRIESSETLLLLASYGIEPSLLWILLAAPLFILPFAINQE